MEKKVKEELDKLIIIGNESGMLRTSTVKQLLNDLNKKTEEDFEDGTTKPEDNSGISSGVVEGSTGTSTDDTSWLPKINLDTAPKEMINNIGKLSHKLPDKMPKEMPGSVDVPDIPIPDEMPKEMPGKQPDIPE